MWQGLLLLYHWQPRIELIVLLILVLLLTLYTLALVQLLLSPA